MAEAIPGPAYRIETARTVIRCWDPRDAPLLKAAVDANLEHLRPFMPWAWSEPTGLQQRIDWLRSRRAQFDLGADFGFGIFSPDERRVLGGTGLHPRVGPEAIEIGYWIDKDHIRQGLATEVSAALTRVAFDIFNVRRVEIHCDPANTASAGVARKLGYTLEATLRQRLPSHDGTLRDSMMWTITREEYLVSPLAATPVRVFDAAGREI